MKFIEGGGANLGRGRQMSGGLKSGGGGGRHMYKYWVAIYGPKMFHSYQVYAKIGDIMIWDAICVPYMCLIWQLSLT